MCKFVEMTIKRNGEEVVVTQQIDCGNPNCPSSDASTGGTK